VWTEPIIEASLPLLKWKLMVSLVQCPEDQNMQK
jgi:hypothetical protein